MPTRLSLGQKQAQRRFVFLLNRIQGDSPGFFACRFSKLFSVTGGSRMCLWSSHLPHYSESLGSKLLGTLIPLLKSSLQLLTGVLKEASFPLVIFMWFTWCYFLISTSYSKGTLFCLRGRTPLGNINTHKLICFHRLEEEKTIFFFMFYICKTYVKRVFVSYRTNKYWFSSRKCTRAGDDETETLCFIQGKCVLSVDYSP